MIINSQCHSLTFVEGYSESTFQTFSNFVPLETAKPIESKFYVAPPADEGIKVSTNSLCQMTQMAAISTYGKPHLNILFWIQKSDDLETLYDALVARVLPNLFK